MLYILCVEVLACKVRSSPDIEGFLLPRASGIHLRFSQYADDIINFVKPIPSLLALFETISLYEKGTGARLNLTRKLARMNCLALRELKRGRFLGCVLVLFWFIKKTGNHGFQSLTSLFVFGMHSLFLLSLEF